MRENKKKKNFATNRGNFYVIIDIAEEVGYIQEDKAMSIIITPTDSREITKLVCPECGERVKNVALRKDSRIEGLTFKCKRCGRFFSVKTE